MTTASFVAPSPFTMKDAESQDSGQSEQTAARSMSQESLGMHRGAPSMPGSPENRRWGKEALR